MYGGFFGFVISLIVILCAGSEVVSWWWLLWGTLIGFVFEVMARLGCGEEFGDAMCSAIDLGSALSSLGDVGGGDSGGDCGGGDGGGGDGGGGD